MQKQEHQDQVKSKQSFHKKKQSGLRNNQNRLRWQSTDKPRKIQRRTVRLRSEKVSNLFSSEVDF